jgi:hypothetical protein
MDWKLLPDGRQCLKTKIGKYEISTVEMFYSHNFPLGYHFETLVFGDNDLTDLYRCNSIEEAEENHAREVSRVTELVTGALIKALEAGNYNAAPATLQSGTVLTIESLAWDDMNKGK